MGRASRRPHPDAAGGRGGREGGGYLGAGEGEEAAAAACFAVGEDDIFIDYLARNALYRTDERVAGGSVLVAAIELFAERLGKPFIRLESVDDRATLRWYATMGFLPQGPPHESPDWGRLHPMEKRVEPLGGAWA